MRLSSTVSYSEGGRPRGLCSLSFPGGERRHTLTLTLTLTLHSHPEQAAERWQASPMNPQNGGARFPQVELLPP